MMLSEAIPAITRIFPHTVMIPDRELNWYEQKLVLTSQTLRFSGEHPSAALQKRIREAQ
jgi:hypothetical protein